MKTTAILIFFLLFISAPAFAEFKTKDTKHTLGLGTDADNIIQVDKTGTDNPYIKWKASDSKWYFSNNGIAESELGSGSGGGGIDDWITGNLYDVADVVIESNKIYYCLLNHTSGTFAADLAGNAWVLIANEAVSIENVPAGNLAATNVQDAVNELQGDIDTNTSDIATNTASIAGLDSTYATDADVALKADIASPTFTGTVSGITKAMVGLGSVDDTSDADKPISDDTQDALDLKANIASPVLTGDPQSVTPTNGDNDTSIATTAFVTDALTGASIPDADATTKGKIQLAGDLSGTATAPTVPGKVSGPISVPVTDASIMLWDGTTGRVAKQINSMGTSGQFLKTTGAGNNPVFANGTISGKPYAGSSVTVEEIQTHQNQLTQTATGKYQIETGNRNLLSNPGFEHSSVSSGWTQAVTGTATLTETQDSSCIEGSGKCIRITCNGGASGGTCSLKQSPSTTAGLNTLIGAMYKSEAKGVSSGPTTVLYTLVNGTRTTSRDVSNSGVTESWEPFYVNEVSTGSSMGFEALITVGASNEIDLSLEWAKVSPTELAPSAIITPEQSYTPTFQGLGTPTNVDIKWRQLGSKIEVSGSMNVGTVSASEVQIGLPNSFTIKNGTASTQVYGRLARDSAVSNSARDYSILGANGHSYFGLGYFIEAGTVNPLTRQTGSAAITTGQYVTFHALIPVNELSGSTQVFASQCGAACENVLSANVSSTGVVSGENVDFISGNCSTGAAGTCTFTSTYSSPLKCSWGTEGNPGVYCNINAATTTSQTSFSCRSDNGTVLAVDKVLTCTKNTADYQSSRTIVGSFKEVMTVPGVTKPKTCYYAFGGASATISSPTACTTGTCVEVWDSCGTGSPPSYNSTGYVNNLTWASGTWANSTMLDCRCTSFNASTGTINQCFPYWETGDDKWASSSAGGYVTNINQQNAGAINGFVTVSCTGQAP